MVNGRNAIGESMLRRRPTFVLQSVWLRGQSAQQCVLSFAASNQLLRSSSDGNRPASTPGQALLVLNPALVVRIRIGIFFSKESPLVFVAVFLFDDLLELDAVARDPGCTVAGSLGNFIWNITRPTRPGIT